MLFRSVIETPVASLFPGLNAKRYEFIAAPIVVTSERAQQMLFTEPYMSTAYGTLLHIDEPDLASLDGLKGKTVAMIRGGQADAWVGENGGRLGFEPQRFDRAADVIQSVVEKKSYAAVMDLTLALQTVKQVKLVKTGPSVPTGRVIAFAFRQDDAAFRNRVELIVEEMKRDGQKIVGVVVFDYQALRHGCPPLPQWLLGNAALANPAGRQRQTNGEGTPFPRLARDLDGAAVRFVNALEEAADVTLVDFDTEVRVATFAPPQYDRLFERLRGKRPSGNTALYDAVGM